MKKLSPSLLIVLFMGLLSWTSCEEPCEPVDVDALNSIYLQFDTSGEPGSFSPQELDSIYMVRFQIAEFDSFNFPVDTVNLYELDFFEEPYRLRLGKGYPQGLSEGPPYYTNFMYLFKGRGEDFQVRLQSLELEGSYTGECSYESSLKQFVLNDDTLNQTGSTEYVLIQKD